MQRVDGRDVDARGGQQPLDVAHGGHEPARWAALNGSRSEPAEFVGAAFEHGPFRDPRR